ncbi:TPA: hypothetical protein EYH33_05495 [Candidatus Bipolaricaulota bacterium]|nr:hypothetical protein [Candidatus Bipolaricaulota bacterium]
MEQGRTAMELLVSLAEVMDTVRGAVDLLEKGDRDRGLARLSQAIAQVQSEISAWEGIPDPPLPRDELLAELRGVLGELKAARTALISAPKPAP